MVTPPFVGGSESDRDCMASESSVRLDVNVSTVTGTGFRQGLWHNFSVPDGLPSSIYALHQDADGNIWFATEQGVSWFDGSVFRTLNPLDGFRPQAVHRILEDRSGNMWFATDEGVNRFDGTRIDSISIHQESPAATHLIVEDGNGSIWLSAGAELCRLNGSKIVHYSRDGRLQGRNVLKMLPDRAGRMWFATSGGLNCFDGFSFREIDGLNEDAVVGLVEDNSGAIWFATNRIVGRCEGAGMEALTSPDQFDASILRLVNDQNGDKWLLTEKAVYRFDGTGFVERANYKEAIAESLHDFLVDREGNIWFAATLSGVYRHRGNEFNHFTTAEGLAHDAVNALLEDREGRLWVGTHGGGASRYDGTQFTIFTTRDGLGHNGMDPLLADRSEPLDRNRPGSE